MICQNVNNVTMLSMSDGGKGSAPRPIPDPQKFRDNWDAIFGKKPKEDKPK